MESALPLQLSTPWDLSPRNNITITQQCRGKLTSWSLLKRLPPGAYSYTTTSCPIEYPIMDIILGCLNLEVTGKNLVQRYAQYNNYTLSKMPIQFLACQPPYSGFQVMPVPPEKFKFHRDYYIIALRLYLIQKLHSDWGVPQNTFVHCSVSTTSQEVLLLVGGIEEFT